MTTGLRAEPTGTTMVSRRAVVLAALGVGAVGIVAAAVDPTHGPVVCPFRLATGLDCPLCGATRAVHSLATGHPLRAADHNLLVAIAVPLLVVALVVALVATVRGRPVRLPRVGRATWIALAALIVGFWVVRNLAGLSWLGSA